jgi:hypothetical protein
MHYPPGQAPTSFVPGDFSLHRATTNRGRNGATTKIGRCIQAGERVRYGNTDFARWTHSALIVSETGDVCEALESGVARDNIEKYRGTDYMIVHPAGSPAQRALAGEFAEGRVGDQYGVLDFAGLAVQCLFGWNLSIQIDGQFICSGLVARATEKYIAGYPRASQDMMPADLAYYWGAESEEPIPAPGLLGRFLNVLPLLVDILRETPGDPALHGGDPAPHGGDPAPPGGDIEAGRSSGPAPETVSAAPGQPGSPA